MLRASCFIAKGLRMPLHIAIDRERIKTFCRKWKVRELSIFGSALRDDFGPGSDIDVLVAYDEEAAWDVWDHLHAEEELKEVLGRDVDLVAKTALRNPFRREHILLNREIIYAT